jgi:cholesterol oxidase
MEAYDVVVIGSGFGGSVAALRLTEKGYRVAVLEAGRRFDPEDFGRTNWNLRRFLWMPHLRLRGIQRLNLLRDILVLSGAGVGGGSLVYANTLIEPQRGFFEDRHWSGITDWRAELAPYYDTARRVLGAAPAPSDTPADLVMRRVAEQMGAAGTVRETTVGVYFGEPGVTVPDPYFSGTGPPRRGCIECGGCMVGCREHAKNTVDRNYLWLAERAGAQVYPECEAVDVAPLASGGYRIDARRPGTWVVRRRRSFTARHVLFAAGALGTTRLLLRLRDEGRLPGLSERLGRLVRTNSESLLGATAPNTAVDYSQGVAITSSFEPAPDTRIEPVRYPPGSNVMGLLGTILVPGEGRLPQPVRFLAAALRHPIVFARSLSVRRWSERSIIVLVMQSIDNSIRLFRRSGRFRFGLTSGPDHGEPNPRWLPVGHEAARRAAAELGGFPGGSINESLLGIPITAHVIGGATIGATEAEGVVDPYHRVFGHPGLHVVDGAAVPANLGSNPSLTITAMAERAMAMWPNAGEPDPRPAHGEPYRAVPAVAARRPTLGT